MSSRNHIWDVTKEFMKRRIAGLVPGFLRPALKRIYYFPIDLIDQLKGRDRLIPPRSMIFVGDGDFVEIGNEFKRYFIDLADLHPNERVLDVGCGIGRMAVPLTDYLSEDGEYWGFDIVKEGIDWCQTHISSRFGNFHFQHIDVYNKAYSREGKLRAETFRFPFEDGYFDFVFLTSVFTHMLPSDLKNYLSQISRVLKQGGRCLITFFILNEESVDLIRAGRSTLNFTYQIGDCLTVNGDNPEAAIAYNEDFVKRLFADYNLSVIDPIHYGSWCRRDTYLSYQDIVVATKTDAN
jgi:SAM-dependent methyltransferase